MRMVGAPMRARGRFDAIMRAVTPVRTDPLRCPIVNGMPAIVPGVASFGALTVSRPLGLMSAAIASGAASSA